MRLETFFEKFEQFAEAPNAVAKMRELVLHLAVAGRLVTSDQNWQKKPLKSLASKIGSGATPAGGRESYFSEGVPLIRSMNVHFRGFDSTGLVFLSDEQAGKLANVVVQVNDVLLNITGASIGRVTTAPPEMAGARVNQHVTIIRPTTELLPRFLTMFLASPAVQWMIDDVQVGATRQALTKNMIEKFEIPLPTLAEQKRIVTKVDELMALCDQLEAQQQERDTRHTALARAALARFADAPTPENLNLLFHTSYAIEPADIRKTILSLAVQGKLVTQDASDEPAEKLLAEIAKRIGKSQKSRTTGDAGFAPEAKRPFALPPGWAWSRFPALGEFGRGKSKHRPRNDHSLFAGGHYRLVQTGDVARANGTIKTHTGLYNDVGLAQSKMWPSGTLCITIAANIADSGVLGFDACFPDSIVGFIPSEPIPSVRYFEYFMRTAKEHLEKFAPSTAQKNINLGILEQVWIPIPPLAEQRRIVAKVDQLMALVDKLETELTASRSAAANLMDAVVAELTALTE